MARYRITTVSRLGTDAGKPTTKTFPNTAKGLADAQDVWRTIRLNPHYYLFAVKLKEYGEHRWLPLDAFTAAVAQPPF